MGKTTVLSGFREGSEDGVAWRSTFTLTLALTFTFTLQAVSVQWSLRWLAWVF